MWFWLKCSVIIPLILKQLATLRLLVPRAQCERYSANDTLRTIRCERYRRPYRFSKTIKKEHLPKNDLVMQFTSSSKQDRSSWAQRTSCRSMSNTKCLVMQSSPKSKQTVRTEREVRAVECGWIKIQLLMQYTPNWNQTHSEQTHSLCIYKFIGWLIRKISNI